MVVSPAAKVTGVAASASSVTVAVVTIDEPVMTPDRGMVKVAAAGILTLCHRDAVTGHPGVGAPNLGRFPRRAAPWQVAVALTNAALAPVPRPRWLGST
ncbi:MAG: hypothetical protein ABIS21_07010 [Acidimicrobiales bacterium]